MRTSGSALRSCGWPAPAAVVWTQTVSATPRAKRAGRRVGHASTVRANAGHKNTGHTNIPPCSGGARVLPIGSHLSHSMTASMTAKFEPSSLH